MTLPACTETHADPQVDGGADADPDADPDADTDADGGATDDAQPHDAQPHDGALDVQAQGDGAKASWEDAFPARSLEAMCGDLAAAKCAQAATCAGGFVMKRDFDGPDTCKHHMQAACIAEWSSYPANAHVRAKVLGACYEATKAQACDAFRNEAPVAACAPKGAEPSGSACGADLQCASGYCKRAAAACGTCAEPPSAGAACASSSDCRATPGLLCASGHCVAEGAAGDPCNASLGCGPGLACTGLGDAAFGTCTAVVQKEGDACSADVEEGASCDVSQGLRCGASAKCKMTKWATAGRPCGFINDDFFACVAGGVCVNGTCEARAHVGEACDDAHGHECAAPSTCKSGVCAFADPTSCQ